MPSRPADERRRPPSRPGVRADASRRPAVVPSKLGRPRTSGARPSSPSSRRLTALAMSWQARRRRDGDPLDRLVASQPSSPLANDDQVTGQMAAAKRPPADGHGTTGLAGKRCRSRAGRGSHALQAGRGSLDSHARPDRTTLPGRPSSEPTERSKSISKNDKSNDPEQRSQPAPRKLFPQKRWG